MNMEYSGLVLVEITGIPLELLGFGEEMEAVEGVEGFEGGSPPGAARCVPDIQLMKCHGSGRDCDVGMTGTGTGTGTHPRVSQDQPHRRRPPPPIPPISPQQKQEQQRPDRTNRNRNRTQQSGSSHARAVTQPWNQHCCGANATALGVSAHPSVLTLHRRHPTVLDERMVKIK